MHTPASITNLLLFLCKLVTQTKILEEIEANLLSIDELEHMLRAFILKIQVSDSLLDPLPEGEFDHR